MDWKKILVISLMIFAPLYSSATAPFDYLQRLCGTLTQTPLEKETLDKHKERQDECKHQARKLSDDKSVNKYTAAVHLCEPTELNGGDQLAVMRCLSSAAAEIQIASPDDDPKKSPFYQKVQSCQHGVKPMAKRVDCMKQAFTNKNNPL